MIYSAAVSPTFFVLYAFEKAYICPSPAASFQQTAFLLCSDHMLPILYQLIGDMLL